jgi:thioredoxin 1
MGGGERDCLPSFALVDGRRTMEILKVDEANFTLEVLEAALPVLVDFTAAWCGPCKMLDPVVKLLAQEWEGSVKVVKLDIDENQGLTVQYQVMGVPTLMLFVKGQPVQRVSGYMPKDKLVAKFKPFL